MVSGRINRILAVVFAAAIASLDASAADDVLALAKVNALPGQTVKIPITIRDVGGTTLNVNTDRRIQVIEFTVHFPRSVSIEGCAIQNHPACEVDFEAAGVLTGLKPAGQSKFLDASSLYVKRTYSRVDSPIPFTLNGPGDLIGYVTVKLDPEADPGELAFNIDRTAVATKLADEVVPSANEVGGQGLTLVDGSITIPDCSQKPPDNAITIFYTGNTGCSPSTSCELGETITFTADTRNYPLNACHTILWRFGDGAQSTALSPTHAFSSPGTKLVALDVTTAGGTTTYTRTVTVDSVDPPPGGCAQKPPENSIFINYTGSTSGCRPGNNISCSRDEQIAFSVSTFNYTLQSCHTFLWKFGDNTTSTLRTPTKSYNTDGPKNVTLTVTSGGGSTDYSSLVTISGGAPVDPCAFPLCTASVPASSVAGTSVTFSSDLPASCRASSIVWDFGDGSTPVTTPSSTITRTYGIPGTYTWTMTFTRTNNARCQVSRTITITPAPSPPDGPRRRSVRQ